jgi:hypothetical protein
LPKEFWDELTISRAELESIVAAQGELEKTAPAVGSQAPNFRLEELDRGGNPPGSFTELEAQRGTPVALLFGSYT